MTVVVPTLTADSKFCKCMQCLNDQKFRDFEVVAVDNSGRGLVRQCGAAAAGTVLENTVNAGYGAAVNQAVRQTKAPLISVLNDDTEPHAEWLDSLVHAMDSHSDVGMCASQVRLAGEEAIDSAGMLISSDGSSKQRGHGEPFAAYSTCEEVLLPSGSAALYRRELFEQVGGFDEEFFLYCEDTDLGLRARWAGWRCLYVPSAVVDHHYSHSAGRASGLKAFYVERNRLYLLAKNFPLRLLWRAPFYSLARYFWHVIDLFAGRGKAAHFRKSGSPAPMLAVYVLRAHLGFVRSLLRLLRQRREIRSRAKIGAAEFVKLLRRHSISARQVASL